MRRSRYRLDHRPYRGIFCAGFFAQLSRSKFWQSENDPYYKAKRKKRRILWFVLLLAVLALVWVGLESTRALHLF